MKKVIITIIVTLILNGCDKIKNELIDNSQNSSKVVDVQIVAIEAPSVIIYSGEGTAITVTVEIQNSEFVEQMWFEIEAASGSFSLVKELEMKDDGDTENSGDLIESDSIFTGRHLLNDQEPNSEYSINYYYKGSDGIIKKIGSSNFHYFSALELEIVEITAPSQITYTDASTHFKATVEVNTNYVIKDIWYEITSSDGKLTLVDCLQMRDDGDREFSGDQAADDNIFTAQKSLGIEVPSGEYTVKYFIIKNFQDIAEEIGSTNFTYDNSQFHYAPVISNLMIPGEIDRDVTFSFSVDVFDENGLADILSVNYKLYRPNGELIVNSKGIADFPLFDSGNFRLHEDKVAGDGVYTAMLKFPAEEEAGEWIFIFHAKDSQNKVSNEIIHILELE